MLSHSLASLRADRARFEQAKTEHLNKIKEAVLEIAREVEAATNGIASARLIDDHCVQIFCRQYPTTGWGFHNVDEGGGGRDAEWLLKKFREECENPQSGLVNAVYWAQEYRPKKGKKK